MVILKWIEVNIKYTPEISKDEYLTKYVRKILNECSSKYYSWHYLWEGKPWSNTLMLRFIGDDKQIDDIKQILEEELKELCYCYGEHGDCGEGKEYKGEANYWGSEAWKKGIKFMELGSEFALELIENKDKLGISPEYKKNVYYYADRYTHLFLNQIETLLRALGYDEVIFNLNQGFCRLGHNILINKDRSLTEEERNSIISLMLESTFVEIGRITKEKTDRAYRKFIIQKQRKDKDL